MGNCISAQGIKPDTKKIKAILEMKKPENSQEARKLCGMVQYLSKFLNNLSEVSQPLRELTKKDCNFRWTEKCEEAFNKIKTMITNTPVFIFYNPDKKLEIQVDSSQHGLGAVLMQEGQPIEFASRALTPTEKRWAQIEKELFAVVFGLERFNQYTFGRHVIIINDHKPLANILRKPLNQAPRRLQNLMLRSNRYDFSFQWVEGNSLHIADTLSRLCNQEEKQDEVFNICQTQVVDIPNPLLERIKQETDLDDTLNKLSKQIMNGWPQRKQDLDNMIRTYFDFADTLGLSNGVILKGERIVIPFSMRQEMKKNLHTAHIAYDGMMRRPRQTIFWPGKADEIKQRADMHCLSRKKTYEPERNTYTT
ncbi:retrovirus related pol protein [Biomphalaria glabrata]|nr:retrovirus related pol protein [Biomphalaria glabrata]